MRLKSLSLLGKLPLLAKMNPTQEMRYTCWQECDWWLGYLEDYPDYWTQGRTPEELESNLRDILITLVNNQK